MPGFSWVGNKNNSIAFSFTNCSRSSYKWITELLLSYFLIACRKDISIYFLYFRLRYLSFLTVFFNSVTGFFDYECYSDLQRFVAFS